MRNCEGREAVSFPVRPLLRQSGLALRSTSLWWATTLNSFTKDMHLRAWRRASAAKLGDLWILESSFRRAWTGNGGSTLEERGRPIQPEMTWPLLLLR